MADRQARRGDQRHHAAPRRGDQDGDLRGVAGKRHAPGAAGELAVGAERDIAVLMHRGDRHRPARHGDLGPRQKPAGEQRLGERHRGGETAGRAQHRKPVGHRGAGAAEFFRDPGERQPRFFERIPQRLRPHALLGIVDRGGLAQILENPGRGIDDDGVGVIVHFASGRGSLCGDRRAAVA